MSPLPGCLYSFSNNMNDNTNASDSSWNDSAVTSCISFRAVQISFFVGAPIILLLLIAVLGLTVAMTCVSIKLRSARRMNRIKTSTSGEFKQDTSGHYGDSMGPEDSFESIDNVVETRRLDTIVNSNYDEVELKTTGAVGGEANSDAERHQYSNIKEKKKKTKGRVGKKKIPAEGAGEKDSGYNKLVHGSDPIPQVSIDIDSYSALLDKPKNEAEVSNDNGISKAKALPPIPSQSKHQPQTSSPAKTSLQVSSADAYVAVPLTEKKEEATDNPTIPETVYYNDAAVTMSKVIDEAESNKDESEREKRLNIYSQSISLQEF